MNQMEQQATPNDLPSMRITLCGEKLIVSRNFNIHYGTIRNLGCFLHEYMQCVTTQILYSVLMKRNGSPYKNIFKSCWAKAR
jgi:hypothetical protein